MKQLKAIHDLFRFEDNLFQNEAEIFRNEACTGIGQNSPFLNLLLALGLISSLIDYQPYRLARVALLYQCPD